MARKQEPNSVATIVGLLLVDSEVKIEKKISSVSVMVSMLKKQEAHKEKKFKIKCVDGVCIVSRIK